MDTPASVFENSSDNQANASDRKSIDSKKYFTEEDLGLDALVFNNPILCIDYRGLKNQLINIKITSSKQFVDNLIEENSYERLTFPIFMVQGVLKGENEGSIAGVIKPKIITSLFGNKYTKPVKGEMPEFHFYLSDSIRGCFEGRSSHRFDNEATSGIGCGIRECGKENLKAIGPDFSVDKVFSDICNIYYHK